MHSPGVNKNGFSCSGINRFGSELWLFLTSSLNGEPHFLYKKGLKSHITSITVGAEFETAALTHVTDTENTSLK